MRTIAVVLCDNDFLHTFPPLLKSVGEAIKAWEGCRESERPNEAEVEALIRSGLEYFYRGFQLGGRGRGLGGGGYGEVLGTVKYLQSIKVLFDEAAEQHIQSHDDDGGSWYLEVTTGNVYSY